MSEEIKRRPALANRTSFTKKVLKRCVDAQAQWPGYQAGFLTSFIV